MSLVAILLFFTAPIVKPIHDLWWLKQKYPGS